MTALRNGIELGFFAIGALIGLSLAWRFASIDAVRDWETILGATGFVVMGYAIALTARHLRPN